MSNAWEGYYDESHVGRRRRRKRPLGSLRYAALIAGMFVIATGLLLAQHQSKSRAAATPNNRPTPGAVPRPRNLAEATLVVYNSTDPISRELADYYAAKRAIPAAQVVGLKCPQEEEISREDYDTTIAEPLRAVFDQRGWWTHEDPARNHSPVSQNRIRFVALVRGVPLKIRPTAAPYPGDPGNGQPPPISGQNAAGVDSELAVLGFYSRAIAGFTPNPYFRSFSFIGDADLPRLLLVTRLDAPTPTMVRRMIDDSLAAEKAGLWGRCYLDNRGFAPGSSPLAEGDEWISRINRDTAPYVMPTIMDRRPEMFSREYPMTDAALYFGWYSENVAGPFTRPEFHFARGAVACHLHSYSAVSLRDPAHHWVAPLIERGAAAALGNVYEPYLSLTVHMDILAARLLDGFTLAESAYAATPGLSWMDVVVGDPLYRPAKALQDLGSTPGDPPAASLVERGDADGAALITEGRAYWRGAQTWRGSGMAAGSKALEQSARELHSGLIYEGLGLLRAASGDAGGAKAAFEHARECYKFPLDDVRVILDEAQVMADAGEKTAALELLRKNKPRYANQIVGAALDQLEAVLSSTP